VSFCHPSFCFSFGLRPLPRRSSPRRCAWCCLFRALSDSYSKSGGHSATAPLGTYVRTLSTSPPQPLPPPKNRECQICPKYTPFDAPSGGDAGGTLRFCICWAVLSRKTGVRRAVTYPTYVRVLSREGFFENFRFRPTTSHSTRNPLAMSATPSVSAADHFLRESGRPRPLARQESASVNFIMGRPTFSSPQPESTADSLPRPNPRILSSNFSSDWRIW
jgi:hypothetical protein